MRQPSTPSVIDVEASGFGGSSYPIEVGVVLADGRRFCSLIRPVERWTHWSEQAEGVHGIPRAALFTHGRPVREVADELNAMAEGMTLYSDGWVVDKPWIITLFEAAGRSMAFRISPLDMILTETQMERWHPTKNRIIEQLGLTRHRASYDAWVVQETFRLTQTDLSEVPGELPIRALPAGCR